MAPVLAATISSTSATTTPSGVATSTWISIALSVVALALGGLNLYRLEHRYRRDVSRAENRDARDLLLSVHQTLVAEDASTGRYLLYEYFGTSVRDYPQEIYQPINRAIANFDMLGLYLERGYLPEPDIMDLWAEPICRAWVAAQPFIDYREQHNGWRPWPYFKKLAERADKYLLARGVDLEPPAPRAPRSFETDP